MIRLRALLFPVTLLLAAILVWSTGPSGQPTRTRQTSTTRGNAVKPSDDRPAPAAAAAPAANAFDAFDAFDQWARAATASPATLSRQSLQQGIELAARRRSVLKQWIQDDPEASLAKAIPWKLRRQLPPEITGLLEDRISASADYSVLAAVPQPGETLREPPIHRTAVIGETIYQAHVYGERTAVDSKRNLPIDGIAVDDQLAVLDTPLRPVEAGEPVAGDVQPVVSPDHSAGEKADTPQRWISGGRTYELCCARHAAALAAELAADELTPGPTLGASASATTSTGIPVAESSWTEGTKSLLVIRVDFSDLPGPPEDGSGNEIDATYLTQRVNTEVANWIEEVSYSKSSMTLDAADVTAVLRMPQTAATYANGKLNDDLRLDALSLASAAGFTPSNYDRVAMVFSQLGTSAFPSSQITYAGLGQIGASFSWFNGNFSFGTSTHEFGHNYGLRHANLWQIPGNSNPVDPAGSSIEYGDVFDMMGSSPSDAATNADHFNPWFLNRLDWLEDESVETVTTSGSYRVYRYDHQNANAANTLALKVDRTDSENYWIGYRRKYLNHPSRGDISNGAYFTWGYDYQNQSNLIDLDTPGSSPNDASLDVGDSFDDTAAGIGFTVTAAGGSGTDEYLDIDITFQPRVSFSQSSYEVDEASGNLEVVLTRESNADGPVSVTLSTSDGSAVSPADFTATSVQVTWPDGDLTPKSVNIPITADSTTEGSESFTITLSGITGGIIVNQSTVTANILEPGASDAGFAHGFFNSSGTVHQMALQPDRRIAFVGLASGIGGIQVGGVGRFEPDGTLDESFSTASSSNVTPVNAIARQPDGKTLIAGNFTTISGVSRIRVARLNEDGSLDTGFDPGSGPDATVEAMVLRPDGRILIAGSFSSVAGTARQGIAQLLPDGSLDPAFLATPLSQYSSFSPECLALQADGMVLVGGLLHTGYNQLFSAFSSGLVRLDQSGAIDQTFDIGSGAHASGSTGSLKRVYAIAVQPDGKVVVGGSFTAFNGIACGRLVRLETNGAVDTDFGTALGAGADDLVRSIDIQSDGKILVGGSFDSMSGSPLARVARVSPAGVLDSTFDAEVPTTYGTGYTNICYQVLMQPDTRILIAMDAYGSGQAGLMRVFSAQSAPAGQVEFVTSSATIHEGGTASLSVRRVGGSLGPVSISYATVADTATAADFTPQTGVLTWADGDTADKLITIDTTDDATTEPDELFSVRLGTPIGGTSISDAGSASVVISDLTPIELWRLANFGSTANSGTGADSADYDHDQIPNLIEYALGRSPVSATGTDGPSGLPTATLESTDPLLTGRLTLTCDIPDPAPEDLIYQVEVTGTLASGDWTALATKSGTGPWVWQPGGTARIVETSAGGRSTVEIGDTEPTTGVPRHFMRFQVTRP